MSQTGLHDSSGKQTWGENTASEIEEMLVAVVSNGRSVQDVPDIHQMRKQRDRDLERLDSEVKRLVAPCLYRVLFTDRLWQLRQGLTESLKVGL